MKKILFLSYNYPEGGFGPSTMCTVRIMKDLTEKKQCEVHCFSFDGEGRSVYEIIEGVTIHKIGVKSRVKKRTTFWTHFYSILRIPLFPFSSLIADIRCFNKSKRLLSKEKYDLVVSHYAIEQSLIAGVLLKKHHYIDNLMVLFWDNIYGKPPIRFIPQRFSAKRQYKVENWVAKYANTLVSLYPIKAFHDANGDVPNAKEKRVYLGIPSITRPLFTKTSAYGHLIKNDRINLVYSGTIFRLEYLEYFIELLSKLSFASNINLIIFTRSVTKEKIERLSVNFRGSIEAPGFIPLNELLALYPSVDFFISFPGIATAIRSKVFEYMSYGKPLILMYGDDNDVNVDTFANYPYCKALDYRLPANANITEIEEYILSSWGKTVPFEMVERVFQRDTASAYSNMMLTELQKRCSYGCFEC